MRIDKFQFVELEKSEFVGGMNHVIVVTERIVLFIVCYADKMCSKERWD